MCMRILSYSLLSSCTIFRFLYLIPFKILSLLVFGIWVLEWRARVSSFLELNCKIGDEYSLLKGTCNKHKGGTSLRKCNEVIGKEEVQDSRWLETDSSSWLKSYLFYWSLLILDLSCLLSFCYLLLSWLPWSLLDSPWLNFSLIL